MRRSPTTVDAISENKRRSGVRPPERQRSSEGKGVVSDAVVYEAFFEYFLL
jgi:hypothetical protein